MMSLSDRLGVPMRWYLIIACAAWQLSGIASWMPQGAPESASSACCCCGPDQPCTCGCSESAPKKESSSPPAQFRCRCDEHPVVVIAESKPPTNRLREFESQK